MFQPFTENMTKADADARVKEVLNNYDLRASIPTGHEPFNFSFELGSNEGAYLTIGGICYRIGETNEMALIAYYEAIKAFMHHYRP